MNPVLPPCRPWLADLAPTPSHTEHGGPDGFQPIHLDFSTNANPLPAPPELLAALHHAERQRYPDPHYRALRHTLGERLGVAPQRVLPTAGGSEVIRRLTLAAWQHGRRQVCVPEPGYADYRAAALALGLAVQPWRSPQALLHGLACSNTPALVWLTEPNNPTGESLPTEFWPELLAQAQRSGSWLALDRAYEPLRLAGTDPVPPQVAQHCWQSFSPNKALGLTGVRAGYLLAPAQVRADVLAQLLALAPSWVLSAEGQALLLANDLPAVQSWLAQSRTTLRLWQSAQRAELARLGWQQATSVTPFWLARPPGSVLDVRLRLSALREVGIKLRDASSFGLAGWVRMSAQAPQARAALLEAARAWEDGAC